MITPTRTNLLLLKDRVRSVRGSVEILVSRRQALIAELLQTSVPYLESRRRLRALYGTACSSLQASLALLGEDGMAALAFSGRRDYRITVGAKKLWGVPYKEISATESAVREVTDRGWDYRFTPPVVEEAASSFERIVDLLVALAEHDNKIRRLGREVQRTTRRMRVLEEKILPGLQERIKNIAQHIAERDRETHYRLKEFKRHRQRRGATGAYSSAGKED